ncbi:zinc finger and BTB domain-containing protein 24-like [Aphis craccivora]|uniref:Zinc finger and BTB domain-containing protein 24-like n=1 Tax=Aphis craccivora TaxID=307492 RepID=A0A6G0YEH9_APHCR|nr:zinc finger and BTB domain-containing protein 24-like [Aphis craccivora]
MYYTNIFENLHTLSKSHESPTKIVCSILCSEIFTRRDNLIRHNKEKHRKFKYYNPTTTNHKQLNKFTIIMNTLCKNITLSIKVIVTRIHLNQEITIIKTNYFNGEHWPILIKILQRDFSLTLYTINKWNLKNPNWILNSWTNFGA